MRFSDGARSHARVRSVCSPVRRGLSSAAAYARSSPGCIRCGRCLTMCPNAIREVNSRPTLGGAGSPSPSPVANSPALGCPGLGLAALGGAVWMRRWLEARSSRPACPAGGAARSTASELCPVGFRRGRRRAPTSSDWRSRLALHLRALRRVSGEVRWGSFRGARMRTPPRSRRPAHGRGLQGSARWP